MAVNGIEIKVGQTWKTAGGQSVVVLAIDGAYQFGGHRYPVKAKTLGDGHPVNLGTDGRAVWSQGDPWDLEVLIREPQTPEEPVDATAHLPVFQVGVQFKQTEGGIPFVFAIDDEVTLNDHRVLNVHSIHGRGIEWYYEGYNVEDGRNVHFTERDVVSFRPKGPLQPTADLPVGLVEQPVLAPAILEAAAGHMRDRAATYDKPEGERSMAQTVAIFNLHHGTALTEAQGWHFMQVLKDVRTFTNTANPHRDSIEDGVSYAALKGEALLQGGAQ